MRVLINLLLIVLTTLPLTASAQNSIFDTSLDSLFGNEEKFLPVDQAFQLDFHQQGNKLEIYFAIAEGYYLYKHKVNVTPTNAKFSALTLPTGIEHEDEYFGVQQVYYDQLKFTIDLIQANNEATLDISFQGCADKGLCYPPTSIKIPLDGVTLPPKTANSVLSALSVASSSESFDEQNTTTPIKNQTQQHDLVAMLQGNSLVITLLSFLGLGVLLAFTPCVFPMYPILTGIIVGQGKQLTTRKACMLSFSYVQGMAITYTGLGIVVALAGAQFQAAFQHPAVLIGLSVLFVFLAFSMFGFFNLALPSGWQNKLNNLSNSQQGGSMMSVFIMGAISGLVASPCTTAPLTGALIYIAQTGDVIIGASALYALSIGMGIPLLILGSSGGKLLPKAGSWMNIIKNVFGFLLLAVPVFLLERMLSEFVANLLWAGLLMITATYFYVINNASKNKQSFFYGVRSLCVFIVLFFAANLAYDTLFNQQGSSASKQESHQEFILVNNLAQLNNEIQKASNDGKSVMVDLYADWCIACKEFEKYTFPKPEVQEALHNTILIQVDLTDTGLPQNVEIMETFEVFGLPSILFFDDSGKELQKQRVTGFMGAKEFSTHINQILN